MTFANEAQWDRAVRFIAGIVLLVASILVGGTASVVLAVVGGVALITALAGWCPAYAACGISTRKAASASGTFR